MKRVIFLSIFFSSLFNIWAADGKTLANKYGLSASSKVSVQWIRIFKKDKKMKKLGIEKLIQKEKEILRGYLIDHAADSDTPEAAGM